jgi:hypothetical protein
MNSFVEFIEQQAVQLRIWSTSAWASRVGKLGSPGVVEGPHILYPRAGQKAGPEKKDRPQRPRQPYTHSFQEEPPWRHL